MDGLLEFAGAGLARAYVFYGIVILVLPGILFIHVLLLAAVTWAVAWRARGRQPWPFLPAFARRWGRLAVEVPFGLINPVIYLVVLSATLPLRPSGAEWWLEPLRALAWILLVLFWSFRLFGAALSPGSRLARTGVRTLLMASLACLFLYAAKDVWLLLESEVGGAKPFSMFTTVVRLSPLYLIPAVLLWDYLRSMSRSSGQAFFLLPDRAARVAVAVVAGVLLATVGFAAYRRSDASVRRLVTSHRDSIRAAAARYEVDPRLIASIVYVTHRDQLSPFRDALERMVISAWARNMRKELGIGPPDHIDRIGSDENPMLNRALDISVGLAQIKPRTAQTASVLAKGLRPDDLPRPAFYSYRDVEPVGDGWTLAVAARISANSPIAVPAERHAVAAALLDAESNLATCALIIALYQQQWEASNSAWSLRGRPDMLATLYQIGFARSRPHGAPRSNAFGNRVRQVYEQPWLSQLFATPRTT